MCLYLFTCGWWPKISIYLNLFVNVNTISTDVWPTTVDPFIHSSELDDGGDEERLMVVTTNATGATLLLGVVS